MLAASAFDHPPRRVWLGPEESVYGFVQSCHMFFDAL
jgi:hypothetical protein